MCVEKQKFVSRWISSNLNVEARSIAPDEVKRGGKLKGRRLDLSWRFYELQLWTRV